MSQSEEATSEVSVQVIDNEPHDEGKGTNKIPQAQLVNVVQQKTFFNKLN